ncbi:interleukin-23 receptor-like isoform X1 [Sinocyclocheilus anshuiensis]|uniref:interleukin-23 receptor-like isoform X1 n=1 Tax=Sinocyclocheilus anshuiensis TaxID=1608454 RepID=UPI0007B7B875|nr:PREDICTED: interleukin-23 receptor-like isoform X1 [Sinocyclocheilus anshuiensis]
MDFFIRVWQVVFLLLFSGKFCDCYRVSCVGKLIVDSDVIHLGSNLTVGCQSNTEHCGRHFAIVFNGETIFETINCSVIKTQIVINQPRFWLLCKVKEGDTWHTVCGQDFKAGYPPGNPKFSCVTYQNSEYVNCSLVVTTETYLFTNFTVTFHNSTSQFLQYAMNKDSHVSIPRSLFVENMTYKVHVRGHNALGESHSTFNFSIWDIVIPSTPDITRVVFENGTLSPTICWNGSEDILKPILRFREAHDNQDWGQGSVKELQAGCILMQEALEPLTPYQFELRVCVTSTNCSMWSHPFNIASPGIAPSHKLDVWRVINRTSTHGALNVTVLWKRYTPEYYSGDLLHYKLSCKEEGKIHELNCPAHVTRQTLQLNAAEVNVSAVTAAGSSPPAPVSLIYTGKPAPMITHLVPAAGGSVLLAWDVSHYSEEMEGILGFVVQWQQSTMHLEWKRLGKDYNFTFLQGMRAGVLYNISLYTEEASGVSAPAFVQVYAKEEKPLAGPGVSITNTGEKNILIQWDELNQDKQRGFITNYTIYFQRQRDKRLLQNQTVPNAFPRRLSWELQGQQECVEILVSAWNSAGEGPKGKPATCCCHSKLSYKTGSDKTTGGMIAGICLAAAVPMVILANLMYLKCVRQRMMKMCMSIGVSWIFENLPKFDNSNAIKLLKDDSHGPWGALPGDNDPPLTPIEEVSLSLERQDSYPTVLHVTETPTTNLFCIDSPYKPQLLTASQRNEDFSETTDEELKEEDQIPFLASPSHHDFSWDLSCIPVIHGRLNSFLAMDGALGSLGIFEDLLAPPKKASNKDGGVEENERIVETGDIDQSTFTSQTVLPNDLESCLRGHVFNSSPYSPQGLCHSFSVLEEG